MPLKTTFEGKPPSGRWPRRISKRKVLSVNMISLPLADFRHLAHIGSDAHRDSFGDLSFLKQGHSLLRQSSLSEQNLFMACAPPPKPPRLNLEEAEAENGHGDTDWESQHRPSVQRRKKCSSLPLLDTEEAEEDEYELHAVEAAVSLNQSPGRGSLSSGRDSTQTGPEESQLEEADTSFSFNLDLGPSILDDVLRVMDRINQ